MPLLFLEPHPSVPSGKNGGNKARIGTGRGGAGNYSSYSKVSLTDGPTATGPASRLADLHRKASSSNNNSITSTTTTRQHVFTGIGGAGNVRPAEDRRIFSFDEELERDRKLMDSAALCPVYHIGRGGSGNTFVDKSTSSRNGSAASISSNGSDEGPRGIDIRKSLDGMKGRLSRALSRD